MARATTKADLTSSANEQFNKMWKLIDCMTKSQQEAAFAEEMATVGKETHWSRDKKPARCACTSVRMASTATELDKSQS